VSQPSPRFPLSDHCNGDLFFNPGGIRARTWREVLQWRCTSRFAPWPRWVELKPRPTPPALQAGQVRATWINHATFLIETDVGNFLTDPVYSKRCGPFGLAGPRRVHAPGVAFDDLPRIDAVLLSHDHYDHCDLATLRRLQRRHRPFAITPLGNGDLLARAGFTRVVELDWWQSHGESEALRVTVTPTQHWSNRLSGRRYQRLWGGFFVETGARKIFFVGDTAYQAEHFKNVRERCGEPDLAVIPIGAYAPRWFMSTQHCNPAEAVAIHREVGSHQSVAMHWGTFQLTDEARDDPPRELGAALAAAHVDASTFAILEPGGSITV
jgi:L-ascorbate metabolism protein UlaG (beta-lactamase superfamily)